MRKQEVVDIDGLESLQAQTFTAAYRLAGMKYIAGADSAVREKGSLYITAPQGMELDVFLDGRAIGKTPLVVGDIDFGVHILKASAGDYLFENEINVNSTDITEIAADNSLLRGNLLVRVSNPDAEGYNLQLGGISIEPGLNRDLPVGSFPLIAQGNFWYFQGEAEIRSGQTTSIKIELEKGADIRLNTPDASSAWIISADSEEFYFAGGFMTVPAGDYELVVMHDDYETYRQKVSAVAGRLHEISPLLTHSQIFLDNEKISQLKAERESVAESAEFFTTGMMASFCAAAVGGIVAGVFEALVESEASALETNYAAYKAASISTDAETLRTAVETNLANTESFRLVRDISLIFAGAGAAAGATFLMLTPSTADLDRQIAELGRGAK